MKLNKLFFLLNKHFSRKNTLFKVDVEKSIVFLKQFPSPKDYFERSFFQYKCQRFLENNFISLVKNLLASLAFIPFVLFFCLKKKESRIHSRSKVGAFLNGGVDGIIPTELAEQYDKIDTVKFGKEYFISKNDFSFIAQLLKRYPFSPYFLLKSVYKVAFYRAIINRFDPNAIICSSEYSFTSSLLTGYCKINGIKHINVMHGEKLFNIREAFFQFDECYVWDKHYSNLFISLRTLPTQFRVSPLQVALSKMDECTKPVYEFTYYLGEQTEENLRNIRQAFLKTRVEPDKICVRLHPRYSNKKTVYKIFEDFTIENPYECSIERSFCLTKRIISLYSTVLNQGFELGKEIVIDDLTQRDKFDTLRKLNYIMFTKPHLKFSELIRNSY